MSCLFCNQADVKTKLPDGGGKCDRLIYEDDTSFAVLCPEQYTSGHTLVILKDHKSDITDQVDKDKFNEFSNAIRKVSEILKKKAKNHCGKNPEKVYVCIQSDGIEHLHAHLIPRYPFTERDKANYRKTFIPRDGVDKVNEKIEKGKLGGLWYIALRELEWKNSEFAEKPIEQRIQILEDIAKNFKNDETQRDLHMTRLKHIVAAIVSVFAILVISAIFMLLYVYRYFPFSCATGDYAFLGTSFGMSVPEAKRALRKHGAILTDFKTFKTTEAEVLSFFPSSFIPVYSEDRPSNANFTLYMPSIKIFNAITQAEFTFRNKRLNAVGLHFQSEVLSESQLLVENLQQHLQKRYKYIAREESAEVPEAYTLIYGNAKVNAKMWVNLTDMKKPIISIWLLHLPTEARDISRIKSREDEAF